MIAPPCDGIGKVTPDALGRRVAGAMLCTVLAAAMRWVDRSAFAKKNSLSLRMGPPRLPPNCATMFFGL